MNKKETLQILTILASNYASVDKQMSDETKAKICLETWFSCLGDLEYELILTATRKIIMTKKEFPPTIAEIRETAISFLDTEPSKTAVEAWNEAFTMICNGSQLTQEEFNQSSPEVRMFFR